MANANSAAPLFPVPNFGLASDDNGNETDPSPLVTTTPISATLSGADQDGLAGDAVVDTPKRPRGRPPGSKNKPKQPLAIPREIRAPMPPMLIEISHGYDLISTLIDFAHRIDAGITVLAAIGTVSCVTLGQPIPLPSFTLQGPFNLLSLNGWVLRGAGQPLFSGLPYEYSFSVTLSRRDRDGEMFGGIVAGKVIAMGTVSVMVTPLINPSFHKFPIEANALENGVAGVAGGIKMPLPIVGANANPWGTTPYY